MQSESYETQYLSRIAAEVMEIKTIQPAPSGPSGALSIQGQLRMEAAAAYAHLAPQFRMIGYTPMLRQERHGVALLALPGTIAAGQSRLWLALLLFALTVISTGFVGGWTEGADGIVHYSLGLGLAYSAALLSILLAHEMGHFLVARRLGVGVSYPFFIPMPLLFLGTMGAFIAMKAPPQDRRALLSIGIAGPLAGLMVAIPVLFLGLHLSEVHPLVLEPNTMLEGNSLLYSAMKIAVFGRFLPSGGEDVLLHPVARAGWAGLLVTGLNLLPAGQLDGGHVLFALFGPQVARIVTWIMAAGLLAMGFLWPGWFIWAILITLLGQQRAPLLNEVTPLDRRMQLLAVLGLIVFVLVFVPRPITVIGM
jgi:Zn-dependent protease